MKIDIHGHFVDPHYMDELQRVMALDIEKTSDGKTLMRHNGYTLAWTRPDMFDLDHRLRDMDQKGIDMRVLTVSTPGIYPWTGDAQVRIARHVNDMLAKRPPTKIEPLSCRLEKLPPTSTVPSGRATTAMTLPFTSGLKFGSSAPLAARRAR